MGLTAHLCGGRPPMDEPIKPDPTPKPEPAEPPEPSPSPSPSPRRDSPKAEDSDPQTTERCLLGYLNEGFCVQGASLDTSHYYPVAMLLGHAYRKCVGERFAFGYELHNNAMLSEVFHRLWRLPNQIVQCFNRKITTAPMIDTIEDLDHIQKYVRDDPQVHDANPYSATLVQAYAKAIAELEVAVERTESFVILHHSALAVDILGAMLRYMYQPPTNGHTETHLASDHPHYSKCE